MIYNQVKDREKVTDELSEILGIDRETVQKKVEKRSSREIIKTNVDKETGDAVRKLELPGVKVMKIINGIILMEVLLLKF